LSRVRDEIGSDIDVDAAARFAAPGIRLLPIVHDRVESAAIVRAVLERLEPPAIAVELPRSIQAVAEQAIERLPRISAVLSFERTDEPTVWIVSPGDPLAEGLRWARDRGRRVFFVDPDFPCSPRHRDPVPDPYATWSLGAGRYLELLTSQRFARDELDVKRDQGIAHLIQKAYGSLEEDELVCLLGAAHIEPVCRLLGGELAHPFSRRRRPIVEIRHLTRDSLTGVLPDVPIAHAVWEHCRQGSLLPAEPFEAAVSRPVSIVRHGLRLIRGRSEDDESRQRSLAGLAAREASRPLTGVAAPDRRALAALVWKVAAASYLAQTGEGVEPWQRRLFFDYSRRQARLEGQLAAGLYEWVIAARGVGNDNLAWEVFDTAACYPWQAGEAEIPSVRLDGDDLDLGTRKVRFRRRFLRTKRRPVPVRARRAPEDPGEWIRGFDSAGLCSYPPEDLLIEDYGRFLQKKAVSILSSERSKTEPFSTSLLDGIDLRETLRNAADGRVYVSERVQAPGEAGSVVVIFDPDSEDLRFPFRMTWLGEHDQESDMAFYSTDPTTQVVGPGIVRATYGAFMLSAPRGRLSDVWEDEDYRVARGKAEVLIMAAVDYSEEKIVVHVAARPPASRMKRYAVARGKKILHLPLASLSSTAIEKIRVLHLLAGRDKRRFAKEYVW